MNRSLIALLSLLVVGSGCSDVVGPPPAPPLGQKAKPKTTDDIGEFDPAAGNEVVAPDVKITNPITGPLEAYQPLKQKIAGMNIDYAVRMFHALEGRYPKDYDEFMTRVIRENNMRLPSLPSGLKYQYDVENHKLVVVREDTGEAVE